uniref:Uncharacterized protein n=1 Tax=Glossina pallidipes TaxID=7398 RepID=A0A1A9Z297_GLOPL
MDANVKVSLIACRSVKICSKVNVASESTEIGDEADDGKLFTNTSYFRTCLGLGLVAFSKPMFPIVVFCKVSSVVDVDVGVVDVAFLSFSAAGVVGGSVTVFVDVAFLSFSAAGVVVGGSVTVFVNVTSLASSGVCVVSVSILYVDASARSVFSSSLSVDVTAAFSLNFCVLRAISSKYLGASFFVTKFSKLDVSLQNKGFLNFRLGVEVSITATYHHRTFHSTPTYAVDPNIIDKADAIYQKT